MDTHKVPPDEDVLEQEREEQRRRAIWRRMGVYGLLAALIVVVGVVAVRAGVDSPEQAPPLQPSSSATVPGTEPIGTVTFDGSTCSMEITADRIEPGIVLVEVLNATEERVMFDTYQLLDGYTVRAFAATIERDRRRAEPWTFPSEREVSYLSSEEIPADSSKIVVSTWSPGIHAIVCMEPYEGEVMDFRPFGVVGPIDAR
jgi:hypothetical protein